MATQTLNQTDPQVIEDAVKLLKTDFVALYEQQGYNKVLVGIAWHNIRVTPKARELADLLYPKGKDQTQPLTFISNVAEEIQQRNEEKSKTQKVKKDKPSNPAKNKTDKKIELVKSKSDKGERGRRAKELIAQGATVDELVEKTGIAKLYAQMLIRQSKKK